MGNLLSKISYNIGLRIWEAYGTYPSKVHQTTHPSLPHFIARNNVLPSIASNKIKVIKGMKEIHAIITDMAINSSL